MITDLPALDTYDAEIVTLTGYYSLRIAEAEEAAASARQALTTAEATLAELTSERANAVHQARERLLTATGAEIRDGGIRGKPGRPTRRVEPPALVSPTPNLTDPNVIGAMAALVPTPDPILANLVNDAERGLAAAGVPINGYTAEGVPFGSGAGGGGVVQVFARAIGSLPDEMTTGADAFIADVSEPERTLTENGFSAKEIADMKPAMQQKLRELGYKRDSVHETGKGVWEEAPF